MLGLLVFQGLAVVRVKYFYNIQYRIYYMISYKNTYSKKMTLSENELCFTKFNPSQTAKILYSRGF